MMIQASHVASGFVGAVMMGGLFLAAGATRSPTIPSVIDVQRINVREPDGTLRMVLSGAALEPGIIVAGHEQPHPGRRSAGILFYNNEGTENGGLIFDGKQDSDGTRHSNGSLTFDRYKQDQVVQLVGSEDGHDRYAGLFVNDHPDAAMDFAAIERARKLPPAEQTAAFRAANVATRRRVFVGRTGDGSSELQMRDPSGKNRLLLKVDAAGQATIAFLDPNGRTLRTIGAR
ncbi:MULTISPECIES: hypothetical protein [Sphingomonas]|jgi:hypothetical protein|uniref:hypothetical protein n=1 Tax=Sphingomonas TaxID=13687 RepID=UPI00177CFF79|nr:hypothetical protein [Sphingomonas sp. CFBP 13706]MBD8737241.1 hypothetical protein [Sphingomonas sp. CFBP 13706]